MQPGVWNIIGAASNGPTGTLRITSPYRWCSVGVCGAQKPGRARSGSLHAGTCDGALASPCSDGVGVGDGDDGSRRTANGESRICRHPDDTHSSRTEGQSVVVPSLIL